MKIGDHVTVIDTGRQYDAYKQWAKAHGFYASWKKQGRRKWCDGSGIYRIIVLGHHNIMKKTYKEIDPVVFPETVAGIEDIQTGETHIVSVKGLKIHNIMQLEEDLFEL